ncbi:MAG: type I methionyl aminopeptidase [Candidatus Paceibacterota bacterium]
MIKPKTTEEIEKLAEGGHRLAEILSRLADACQPGVAVKDLDVQVQEMIAPEDSAAFYNYQPVGAPRPYPSHVCVSVNDEIVHGIASESDHVLEDGDVVTVDMGLLHEGLITDSARTIVVGESTDEKDRLLKTCHAALMAGIDAITPDGHVGDISAAIQKRIGNDYSIFRELVGHGVGYSVHEDPAVPNFGRAGTGPKLPVGTVIAIEPMIGLGSDSVLADSDGYTYRTNDASLSAHFEHTVAVTPTGGRILTHNQ